MARILVVEDEVVLGRNLRASLRRAGHDAEWVSSGDQALDTVLACEPDLILLDLKLPGMDGMSLLKALRTHHVNSAVVMMTAHGDVETAVEAMKQGAKDFLTKSGRLSELEIVVDRVLQQRALEDKLRYYTHREQEESQLERMIGRSACLARVKTAVRRLTESVVLASTEPPCVLITGETGTGKDMVARAIHYDGPRRAHPFVHVNCMAVPDTLFESELFGYVRGAFTGARAGKKGMFAVADQGTVFLDEIGDMPPALQAKLLTILERHVIRPIGATAEQAINVHVIAATNRDLDAAVKRGEFREDLFHRLRGIPIHVPPLRERREDIEMLVAHFVAHSVRRLGRRPLGVSPAALEQLTQYDWPGNVRELSHVIENLAFIVPGDDIHPEHLPFCMTGPEGGVTIRLPDRQTIDVDFARRTPSLEEIERQIISAALTYTRFNVSRAARILGVSRDTLRYRLHKMSSP